MKATHSPDACVLLVPLQSDKKKKAGTGRRREQKSKARPLDRRMMSDKRQTDMKVRVLTASVSCGNGAFRAARRTACTLLLLLDLQAKKATAKKAKKKGGGRGKSGGGGKGKGGGGKR